MSYYFNELRTNAFNDPATGNLGRKWRYLVNSTAGYDLRLVFNQTTTSGTVNASFPDIPANSTIAVPSNLGTTGTVLRGVSGLQPAYGQIDLTTDVTALTANAALYTNASGIITPVTLTNGQLLIGSTGAAPVAATLTGTTNQVIVTNGAGSITLSTPQDIDTNANVEFNSAKLNANANQLKLGADSGFETTVTVTPTANRTVTIPDASGTTLLGTTVNAVTEVGRLYYSDGVAPGTLIPLVPGSAGTVLTSGGTNNAPTWASNVAANTLTFTVLSTPIDIYQTTPVDPQVASIPWRSAYSSYTISQDVVFYWQVTTASATLGNSLTLSVTDYGGGPLGSTTISLDATGAGLAAFSLTSTPGAVNELLRFQLTNDVTDAVVRIHSITLELK